MCVYNGMTFVCSISYCALCIRTCMYMRDVPVVVVLMMVDDKCNIVVRDNGSVFVLKDVIISLCVSVCVFIDFFSQ